MTVRNRRLRDHCFANKPFFDNSSRRLRRRIVYKIHRSLIVREQYRKVIGTFFDEALSCDQYAHRQFLTGRLVPKRVEVKQLRDAFLAGSQRSRNKRFRHHRNCAFLRQQFRIDIRVARQPFNFYVLSYLKPRVFQYLLQHIFRRAALSAGNNGLTREIFDLRHVGVVPKDI